MIRFALAWALLASAACFAQTAADPPLWTVGDTWTYKQTAKGQTFEFTNTVKSIERDQALLYGEANRPSGVEKFWWTYGIQQANWIKRERFSDSAPDQRGEVTFDSSDRNNGMSFPLTIGRQWEYGSTWATTLPYKGYDEGTAKVVGYEKIRTAGGEFDAYKIEVRGRYTNLTYGNGDQFELRMWYAPAVKRSVRNERRYWYQGSEDLTVEELVSAKVAP